MQDHPIIVGIGQITDRSGTLEQAVHPLQMAHQAALACIEDLGTPEILRHIQAVSVVNMFSWRYRDPAGGLCEMLKINPAIKEYTNWGGNVPQWLVNRAADRIAGREIEAALVAGAETLQTTQRFGKEIYKLGWPALEDPTVEMIGDSRAGSSPYEELHNAVVPVQVYPLFENALRAERGLNIPAHRQFLGDLWAGFSKTAAQNPHAWFRESVTSREIMEVSEKNRMIGFPYTKRMNPILAVNQAAALILTSTRMARKLSIPEEKWVYIHGCADAMDKWYVTDRVSFTFSPAIHAVGQETLCMAGLGLNDIDFFDLYSCFPSAALVGAKSLGLDIDNLPPLTITGGLAFFGGPGNNYTMHAIAHAVERLRKNPAQFGYVSGLGWHITKHSAGIYSGQPPERPWQRTMPEAIQHEIDCMPGPALNMNPRGAITVETYTVMHAREGDPAYAVVVGRLENGDRCLGLLQDDQAVLNSMETEEFIGRPATITPGNNTPHRVTFS